MAHILLAPDSFKGTMTALEVCEIWEQAVKARLPHMECRSIPLADGGEGMVDAYLKACGGKRITARVHGPFMEEVEAVYGLLPDGTAVLEMASCGGLPLAFWTRSARLARPCSSKGAVWGVTLVALPPRPSNTRWAPRLAL